MAADFNNKKEIVKLRTKVLADGSESIYLDIYIDGKRKYEYLKLYLLPGKANKRKNNETMAIANAVKAQRIVDIQTGRFGFESEKAKNITLLEWMNIVKERNVKKKKSENYIKIARCSIRHLEIFTQNKPIKLKSVDKVFVKGYVEYLRGVKVKGKDISSQSVYLYYMALNIALNVAERDGIIIKNPCKELDTDDKPKQKKGNREYLTLEEVKSIVDVPCSEYESVAKHTFLFSCFTGLRFIDIYNLTWGNIVKVDKENYQIQLIQQKTKNVVVIPLTENAIDWLPDAIDVRQDDKVFHIENYFKTQLMLKTLVKRAGIKKNVTFHVGRHTYATLLLYYGADLYTVSKLLGHTNVKTTQIYAKVMDETKRKAVNLIPNI